MRRIRAHDKFAAAFHEYSNRFGERCLEELKLESITLRDDPLPLLRAVGQLAICSGETDTTSGQKSRNDPYHMAQAQVQTALARSALRRAVFGWVLRHTRSLVRRRENLRFERTRVFGRVRTIFLEIGKRFCAVDILQEPQDIFYLQLDEVLGFVRGTATTTDLKALVAVRRAQYERFASAEPPPDRFYTRGVVGCNTHLQPDNDEADENAVGHEVSRETRFGTACCTGVVRGVARVVRDPRHATLQPGDILVAERTDPGWVILFPSAAALVVERGSLLSHSAIVAREMNLPAVVALARATTWIQDGDCIEIDGGSGRVQRISTAGGGTL
jgi:pyruvate,water dikinase